MVCPFIPTPVLKIGLWTCAISKPYQTHIWAIYGSFRYNYPYRHPILLWILCHIKTISNPYMGHRLSHIRPIHGPYMSHITHHMTSGSMSPRSIFPTAQRFPIPKHVTSVFRSLPVPVTSFPVM